MTSAIGPLAHLSLQLIVVPSHIGTLLSEMQCNPYMDSSQSLNEVMVVRWGIHLGEIVLFHCMALLEILSCSVISEITNSTTHLSGHYKTQLIGLAHIALGHLYKYYVNVISNDRNGSYHYQYVLPYQYQWVLAQSHQSGVIGGLESMLALAAMKLRHFIGMPGEGLLHLVGDICRYVLSAQMHS